MPNLGGSGIQIFFQPSKNMGYTVVYRIAKIIMDFKEKPNISPEGMKEYNKKITKRTIAHSEI